MSDSSRVRVLFCDRCGAPLDAPGWDAFVLCRFCRTTNAIGDALTSAMPDDGRPRVSLGGRVYVIEGLLARGDSADVFRARWAMRLGELCVLKVTRSLADSDLVRREWEVIDQLRASTITGTEHFAALLPAPIARGVLRETTPEGTTIERAAAVYQWRSGFVHTLAEILDAHPEGIDGRVGVWIWKRLLELLHFVHGAGFVHGAVLPPHVIVHPRDHGATLVGFSTATRIGGRIPARSRAFGAWYPGATGDASPAGDLVMSARCVVAAISPVTSRASFVPPPSLPAPFAALLSEVLSGAHAGSTAWALRDRLNAASQAAYGPGRYSPLSMPGW
jgi:hypothetical protein